MRKIIMAALVMAGLLVMIPESAYSQKSRSKRKSRVENVKNQFDGSYNYEVETVGVGTEGTKSLKVWAYGKNVDEAIALAKKCAVAACIYRGLPAAENVLATPALYPDPDPKWDDFFGEFFDDGGEYLNYVNMTSDGVPSGQDRLKLKKGGYKCGIYVQVLFDRLRKDLEKKGVIASMNSYF